MSFDILNPSRHPLAKSSLQPLLSLSLDLLLPVWVSIVLYEIKLSNYHMLYDCSWEGTNKCLLILDM